MKVSKINAILFSMDGHAPRLPKNKALSMVLDESFAEIFDSARDRESMHELCRAVIREARKNKFTVQRYVAKKSNTIYLRFDFGLAGTMRISDHMPSREHEFNVVIEKGRDVCGEHFFAHTDFHAIIDSIKKTRGAAAKELSKDHRSYSFARKNPSVEALSWGSIV